jgi:hypothetical protein
MGGAYCTQSEERCSQGLASKSGGRTQLGRPSVTGDNIKLCFKNWMKERGLHLTSSECEQVAGC